MQHFAPTAVVAVSSPEEFTYVSEAEIQIKPWRSFKYICLCN
jgi:hypothetical protein